MSVCQSSQSVSQSVSQSITQSVPADKIGASTDLNLTDAAAYKKYVCLYICIALVVVVSLTGEACGSVRKSMASVVSSSQLLVEKSILACF